MRWSHLIFIPILALAIPAFAQDKLTAEQCQQLIEPRLVDAYLSSFRIGGDVYQSVDNSVVQSQVFLFGIACTDPRTAPSELPKPTLVRGYTLLLQKKYAEGIAEIEAAAAAGQATAQGFLALMYLGPSPLIGDLPNLPKQALPVKDKAKAFDLARLAAGQDDLGGYLVLASFYRERGDLAKHIDYSRKAAAKNSNLARLWLGMALALNSSSRDPENWKKDRAEGIQILRELEREKAGSLATKSLTEALVMGDGEELLEGIIRLKTFDGYPNIIEPALRLGRVYERMKDWERARRWFCFASPYGKRASSRPIVCDGKYVED